jgi:tRNA(Leu) C34 or U34 (ribose-2'-O)-methylase TrmL
LISIGLVNPKSASNVGSVLRASGCFGAKRILFTGQRFTHAAKYHTDTQNISADILLEQVDDLIKARGQGAKVVCVELTEGATPLNNFEHPDNALYIFGPEDGTIEQSIIDQADSVVYIPTNGCLNLAATVNIVLYDRSAKRQDIKASNELIKQSRDNNNHSKVKDRT